MTIREIERRTGLERTNIRFYEREGLVLPVRQDNGYRDYSEADLLLLLKIKLLRRLGFSLDDIRSLSAGDAALETALERRLAAIEEERRALDAAEEVCRRMRQDAAAFSTLDAERYLDAYDQALRRSASANHMAPTVPLSDRADPIRCPWRRFFARMLDVALVTVLWMGPLLWGLRINIGRISGIENWLTGLLSWALLVPLEAFCLSRWGTTPGKWLMGIRLEHIDGRRLTFAEAAHRVWLVFVYGEGCSVPLVQFYRLWKSYRAAEDTETPWDEETAVIAQPFCWRHTAGYIAARAVLLGLLVICGASAARPIHRGALTAAEFAENYNGMVRFYDFDTSRVLQPDGTFAYTPANNVVYVGPDVSGFAFTFTEEDGILTAVSFTEETSTFGFYSGTYSSRAILASVALGWSNAHFWDYNTRFMQEISNLQNGVREIDVGDCRLYYEVVPRPDLPDTEYTITFRIERL